MNLNPLRSSEGRYPVLVSIPIRDLMNLNRLIYPLTINRGIVSIPIRDLMNLNRTLQQGANQHYQVSIPIRDLMNLNPPTSWLDWTSIKWFQSLLGI